MLAAGKQAEFTVDNFPDRILTGKVVLVTPASAAEFALIPRDISAGEFTKVVQRIPVKIAIDHVFSRWEYAKNVLVYQLNNYYKLRTHPSSDSCKTHQAGAREEGRHCLSIRPYYLESLLLYLS